MNRRYLVDHSIATLKVLMTALTFFAFLLIQSCNTEQIAGADLQVIHSDGGEADAEFSMITPYVDESDMGPVNEAFSSNDNAPWGFTHNGIDFFPKSNLRQFQAVSSGVVEKFNLWQNDKTSNWQVNVVIKCNSTYSVIYGFEPMTAIQTDGKTQLANISVSMGQSIAQGDVIGRLSTGEEGAHVHFSLYENDVAICPEPFFTPQARESVLKLIRMAWSEADMCYSTKSYVNKNQRSKVGGKHQYDYSNLSQISTFIHNKSDRFIVDMEHVTDGCPFKGINSNKPHGGAHVYFNNTAKAWPQGGVEPENYPPIYAAADGIITHVTSCFRLRTGSDRYGIDLAFAKDSDGSVYRLCYAIEPFIPQPSDGFYKAFITVKEGQKVQKGDVIAYMYTPPGVEHIHIHYHIKSFPKNKDHFMAPVIFTESLIKQFHAKWKGFRKNDGDVPMPACMGYKLGAHENPFGTGASETLF